MFFYNKEPYAKILKQQTSDWETSVLMPFQKVFYITNNTFQNTCAMFTVLAYEGYLYGINILGQNLEWLRTVIIEMLHSP